MAFFMLETLKSSETTLKMTLTSSIKTKTDGWRTHLTDNFNVLGPLHMSPVDRDSPVAEISFDSYFLCKIFDVFIREGGPARLLRSRFLQPRSR